MAPRARTDDEQPETVPDPKGLAYTALEDEHQRQILQERIGQLEREHYNHSLNLTIATENPEMGVEPVENAKRSMNFIEAAHAILAAELKKLPKP